jgi:biotin carboxyl carrier protein
MKMQNEMKAPRGGVVIALHAREGTTVAAGEVLASVG